MAKLHPHTHAVQQAARNLDAVAKHLGEGPKFMAVKPERPVHPDVQRLKGKIPAPMYERLSRTND